MFRPSLIYLLSIPPERAQETSAEEREGLMTYRITYNMVEECLDSTGQNAPNEH